MTIDPQLWDYNYVGNASSSTLTVTAECVVTCTGATPTACGSSATQTINKPCRFNENWQNMGPAYQYQASGKELTKGQAYYLLVQTDGDPIWHAITFTD